MRHLLVIVFLFLSTVHGFAMHDQDGKKKKKKAKTTATTGSTVDEGSREKADKFFFEAERAKLNEDWAEAIRNYKEVLNVDPKNANAWFQIAQIQLGENKFAEATEAARMATTLEPQNKWFLELYANTLMQQGNTKDAVKAYEQLIQLSPNRPDNIINLAYIYMQAGEYQKSIETLDRWEKTFGIDEQIIMQKEKLYLKLNNFEKAVTELLKLVNEYPDDTRYLNMLGTAYMANGKREEAIKTYQRILTIDPSNAEALITLSQIESMATTSRLRLKACEGFLRIRRLRWTLK